jgi:hypothetical protein
MLHDQTNKILLYLLGKQLKIELPLPLVKAPESEFGHHQVIVLINASFLMASVRILVIIEILRGVNIENERTVLQGEGCEC